MWGKDDGDYDSHTSWDETPDEKKEAKKWEKAQIKKERKERRGNVTILLPHLCFRVAPCSSYREPLELSLSYNSGNFHYRTWLVYSDDGLPQMPEIFMSKQVGCTPHLVSSLSFHTLIAPSASVAWKSLLLTLTSIDGHLHSLLISRINVRLSTFLSSLITPIIILYSTHSAMSMACAHVLRKSWKAEAR